jgi:hypothetical protein
LWPSASVSLPWQKKEFHVPLFSLQNFADYRTSSSTHLENIAPMGLWVRNNCASYRWPSVLMSIADSSHILTLILFEDSWARLSWELHASGYTLEYKGLIKKS